MVRIEEIKANVIVSFVAIGLFVTSAYSLYTIYRCLSIRYM